VIESGACDAAKLFAEPMEIVQRLLTLAIARVGRRDPSRIGLEKIEDAGGGLHEVWPARERFSANVAGAHVNCDAKRAVRVEREPARGEGVKLAAPGLFARRLPGNEPPLRTPEAPIVVKNRISDADVARLCSPSCTGPAIISNRRSPGAPLERPRSRYG